MIRRPTPASIAYAWHRNAMKGVLADDFASNDEPQCGFFKRRLVKGGPFVPARIWLDQWIDEDTGELMADEVLLCEVNGEFGDPHEQWTWLCAMPISEAEFNYLEAVRRHVGWHEPEQPQANPRQPIDWLKVNPPQF